MITTWVAIILSQSKAIRSMSTTSDLLIALRSKGFLNPPATRELRPIEQSRLIVARRIGNREIKVVSDPTSILVSLGAIMLRKEKNNGNLNYGFANFRQKVEVT